MIVWYQLIVGKASMHSSSHVTQLCRGILPHSPMSHSRIYSTVVNGVRLAFSMNPAPAKAPILLYLHGGPGMASIPLTQRYNAGLEKHFRFINYDQRGCGLSYYPFQEDESITIELMLADLLAFVEYLQRSYPQAPITLIGHSWGSVLGLEFARKYPQLIRRFIGIGQVVNMKDSHRLRSRSSYGEMFKGWHHLMNSESAFADFLLHCTELKDTGIVRGLIHDLDRGISYISPIYGWKGLQGLIKGSSQSYDRLAGELNKVDFSEIRAFKVPVAFIEGRYDRHLPPQLVAEYADSLASEHKLIWFNHSAHCPQWEEPVHFMRTVEEICKEDINNKTRR